MFESNRESVIYCKKNKVAEEQPISVTTLVKTIKNAWCTDFSSLLPVWFIACLSGLQLPTKEVLQNISLPSVFVYPYYTYVNTFTIVEFQ